MTTSKTVRLAVFVLLGFFLLTLLVVSGPAGRVTAEPAHDVESSTNQTFETFFPIVSTELWKTNCRYGVGNSSNQEAKAWLEHLGAGHYINFEARIIGEPVPESVELLPLIRVRGVVENGVHQRNSWEVYPPLNAGPGGLGDLVAKNPDKVWLIGNEPDVNNTVQDNLYPDTYARGFHQVATYIKSIDPNAQIAIAGLSMMTPGRVQYLDIVWDTYVKEFGGPMPVDVWNMHLYILSEIRPWDGGHSDGKVALGTNPALAKKAPDGPADQECPRDDVYCRAEHDEFEIFKEQVLAMRNWMKDHGQQNKPLIISEYSLLYPFVDFDDPINPTECFLMDEYGRCFTEARVSNYLRRTMNFLAAAREPGLGYAADWDRLVQQWTWYSLWIDAEHAGDSSNLLTDDYKNYEPGSEAGMTEVGLAFRDRARTSRMTVNLVADGVVGTKAGASDVKLEVGFYNNGSTGIRNSFLVAFYKDEGLTQKIGETRVYPSSTGIVNGCSWGQVTDRASVTWPNAPVGTHTIWAKVDSMNDIVGERDEDDNVTSARVTVN